ncbi:helix-turn-helix transcriptional regulator [Nocardia cyriacigeorgica]|uniref:helix-turn-helix domain-containing protein n=1 Tax=Nocardia cyriacigeorgica TaxID=135487 RepID=UPI00189366A3|nr:helix-turn-helix transcriptional regulator [Nocardia cyriacigeorgica]MBF6098965.1 helix-turn-helix transcriptional regulator [Nocardia cyriacigeorgica]MBF6159479.1 helix-turn-helix transcriptional regulator [Nocardia cyriacigeorgica]MBF6198562.1 helix-turn-helix transcriptional regulator [Nocardia cyriacigeorgica]MBF6315842.1 helix-turn-helix transcriptional regulator [Nocardia cyriacigeorgica]MBF6530627.1 helix-turn-helix transcriptional regulator [Nocardia cyriacigeorgica]
MVRQWSGKETRALRDAMRMSIREFAAHLGVHQRLVSKWEAGGSRVHPRPVNQAALDTSLARSDDVVRARFAELISQPATPRFDARAGDSAHSSYSSDAELLDLIDAGAVRGDALAAISERDLIMAAAHEASAHASRAESTNIGAMTLEQLDADVTRIANDYVHIPPVPMMVEMLRVRRRVYRLLEGQQRPADTSHLYLLAGSLSGLLANASTDLGHYDAAAEQIRAARAYAELCGHNGLRAWTRGMHALIEYWSERPRRAVELAQSGLEFADSATARVRLSNIEARIWSKIGSAADTERCLRAATDARDGSGSDTLHDGIGGVFGFPDAKAQYYAGATYIHLGMAEPALAATEQAIELYSTGPAWQRSYGAEALARVDSAAAHLINGSLDGATEALHPVLGLPEDKRIAQLEERLTGVRRRLATPAFDGATEAVALDERIEEFCGTTAANGLAAGSPG